MICVKKILVYPQQLKIYYYQLLRQQGIFLQRGTILYISTKQAIFPQDREMRFGNLFVQSCLFLLLHSSYRYVLHMRSSLRARLARRLHETHARYVVFAAEVASEVFSLRAKRDGVRSPSQGKRFQSEFHFFKRKYIYIIIYNSECKHAYVYVQKYRCNSVICVYV